MPLPLAASWARTSWERGSASTQDGGSFGIPYHLTAAKRLPRWVAAGVAAPHAVPPWQPLAASSHPLPHLSSTLSFWEAPQVLSEQGGGAVLGSA